MRRENAERPRSRECGSGPAAFGNSCPQLNPVNAGAWDRSSAILATCLCAAALIAGCGYGVGGRASRLPPGIHVIAVPVFENRTKQYRIEHVMTEAVVHEFLARTKYRIVSNPADADAVLHGQITSIESVPMVFDTSSNPGTNGTSTTTARATTMLVTVTMSVQLVQRDTGEVLYRNDNFVFREPYEISTDVASFFDEQSTALDRMAQKFASELVADILEDF